MIKTIREQYALRDRILKERLGSILPMVMRNSKADAWIHISKEYHEDPVFCAITPSTYLTARRISIFIFLKQNDDVRCFSLCMPDEGLEEFYEPFWKFGEETQQEALIRFLDMYDPQHISVNSSPNFAFADGLSKGLYDSQLAILPEKYTERFMCDDSLAIKLLEIRTKTEFDLYPHVLETAFSVIEEAFSTKQIIPGSTTCEDVEYFMMQKVVDMGLVYWFHPTIDLQRESKGILYTGVIEKGDLLHCDFGIRYMNLCTDTQRLAYVAKDGEDDVPADLKEAFKINNCFQDIVCSKFAEGKSGNAVFLEAKAQAVNEGIEAKLYSHPCNIYGHGPGPTIGLFNQQTAIPISGDVTMSYDSVYALELNTKGIFRGEEITVFTEETVSFTKEGVTYLYPNRDKIYLIK